MIQYQRGGRWHIINLFLLKGSLFPKSFIVAAPCAIVTAILKIYDVVRTGDVLLENTAWSGFSFLVGFLVVFRTSEAYSRFWGGCTATHQMRAEWMDAASALVSFCKHSKAPPEEVDHFKHLAVRLFSILHAMSLAEIEESEDVGKVMAFDLELIDPSGIDKESWQSLVLCQNKVTLVFTWIQMVITENISNGILSIPPPILSRVFQELANGMVALHEAQKIATVPFPFPYAQTCDALLVLHWCITPFITAQCTANWYWGMVFTFVQVFILWSLNNIAVEIEHPFGGDANDLDAAGMQTDMNMNLLLLLHPVASRSPTLSGEAEIESLVLMGRSASMNLKSAATFSEMAQEAMHQKSKDFWQRGTTHANFSKCAVGHLVSSHPWAEEEEEEEESETAEHERMGPNCSPPVPPSCPGDARPEVELSVAPTPRTPRTPRTQQQEEKLEGLHPGPEQRDFVEAPLHRAEPPAEEESARRPRGQGKGKRLRRTPPPLPQVSMGTPTPSSSSRRPASPVSSPLRPEPEPQAAAPPVASSWRRESRASPQADVTADTKRQQPSAGARGRPSPSKKAADGLYLDLEGGTAACSPSTRDWLRRDVL